MFLGTALGLTPAMGRVASALLNRLAAQSAVALSLRKLNDNYNGKAVRVRRSSDNVEADIGFRTDGSLDEGALMAHVGAENLLTYSQDLSNGVWGKANVTIGAALAVAPDGSLTAQSVIPTAASAIYKSVQNSFTPSIGATYTWSAYVKNSGYGYAHMTVSSSQGRLVYDLTNKVVSNPGAVGATGTITDVGNGWLRLTITFVSTTSVSTGFWVGPLSSNSDPANAYTSDGVSGILVWGAQLNTGPTPLDYCKTTSTATTSGQNLLKQSQSFTAGSWSFSGTGESTVDNNVVAPDGTTTASTYTYGSATGSYAFLSQQLAWTKASQPMTYSVWLKVPTGTANLMLAVSNVTGSTVSSTSQTITTAWQRFSFSTTAGQLANTANIGVGFLGGTAAQVYHVWGAQLNEGSVALPYKATTSTIIDNGSGYVVKLYDQGYVAPELITNGDFADASGTGWTGLGAGGWAIGGGAAVHTAGTYGAIATLGAAVAVSGKQYTLTFNCTVTAGSFNVYSRNVLIGSISTAGTKSFTFTAGSQSAPTISIEALSGFDGSIDNISVKECRDLIQATATNQPRIVFAGLIDRISANLVKNGGFDTDDGSWTKVASAPATVSISGGVVTLISPAGEGANVQQSILTVGETYEVSFNATVTSGSGKIQCGSGAAGAGVFTFGTSGTYKTTLTANGSDGWFFIARNGSCNLSVDNVSVRRIVNGIPAQDRPAIRTDGVSQSMATGSFTVAQPFTRASVLQFLSVTNPNRLLAGQSDTPDNELYFSSAGTLSSYAGTSASVKTGVAVNDKATVVEVQNGSASNMSYNGSSSTVDVGTGGVDGVRLAKWGTTYGSALFGDIIIFPSAIAGADPSLLQANMKAFYGTP